MTVSEILLHNRFGPGALQNEKNPGPWNHPVRQSWKTFYNPNAVMRTGSWFHCCVQISSKNILLYWSHVGTHRRPNVMHKISEADTCTTVLSTTGRQHLRSAARHDFTIPHSWLARYGPRSFATSGPSIWNSLPLTVRESALTFTVFCSRLKSELFKRAYGGHTAPSW